VIKLVMAIGFSAFAMLLSVLAFVAAVEVSTRDADRGVALLAISLCCAVIAYVPVLRGDAD
jgi:Na+/melibiose symporter-like transporter